MQIKDKILILEDNVDCNRIYKDLLSTQYDVTFLTELKELKELKALALRADKFKLLIADMNLPDGDYLEWIVDSRSSLMESIPTIIVSSMEDLEILRTSFEWGAADFLVKPFKVPELLVKVERILRPRASSGTLLDDLTLIENKIFLLLKHSIGTPVLKTTIIDSIWKKVKVNPKTLDVHFSNLRKKIAKTEWQIDSEGSGWKLIRK